MDVLRYERKTEWSWCERKTRKVKNSKSLAKKGSRPESHESETQGFKRRRLRSFLWRLKEDTIRKKSRQCVICMIYSTDHTINVWFSRQEFLLYQLLLKKTREGWCVKEREREDGRKLAILMMVSTEREDRQRVKERRVRNEMRGWNFFSSLKTQKREDSDSRRRKTLKNKHKRCCIKILFFSSSSYLPFFFPVSLSVSRGTKNETEEEKLNKKVENETCGILCQDFLLSLFLFCLSLEATFHFPLFDLCLYCICYSLLLFVWSRILPFYCSWFTVSPGFWWCLLSFPIFLRLSLSLFLFDLESKNERHAREEKWQERRMDWTVYRSFFTHSLFSGSLGLSFWVAFEEGCRLFVLRALTCFPPVLFPSFIPSLSLRIERKLAPVSSGSFFSYSFLLLWDLQKRWETRSQVQREWEWAVKVKGTKRHLLTAKRRDHRKASQSQDYKFIVSSKKETD